ncbi:unnamed protein product [Orchesella dallaii]|uniref:Peptidase S1 domain-containing protein n=1 Tax=Orchesella dallaii TaxID=48710 RepID=A0ABP1PZ24_9HEXA
MPACLPQAEDDLLKRVNSKNFTASGFGITGVGEAQSDTLQIVNLNGYSWDTCNDFYKEIPTWNIKFPYGVTRTQVCAGDAIGRKDTCQGDSGGPLLLPDKKKRCIFNVVGITSVGPNQCGEKAPAIYTNVLSYLDWIEDTTQIPSSAGGSMNMITHLKLITIGVLWMYCALWKTCSSQLLAGRSCSTGGYSIVRGECRKLSDCPAALSNLRAGIYPSLCYQEVGGDDQPIVCCPTKRISALKCEEYTRQVAALFSTSDIQPFYGGGYVDPSRNPGGIRSSHCNNTKQALISGGRDADIDEMSFTVALGYADSGKDISWKCGGTLISEDAVISAAHCLDGKASKPPTRVLLGDKRLKKLDTFSGVRRIEANIAEIHVHPGYKRPVKYHDIGIIKLDRKVKFSRSVQPACLPRPDYRPESTSEFFTAGWGRLEFGGKQSDMLQVVNLNKYSLKDCHKVFVEDSDGATSDLPEGITKSQICAGDKDGDKDSCDGDSGGPLSAKREKSDCIQYLLGVTSFGIKLCGYGSPAVYTNVQSYLDWIESIVWAEVDI